MDTTGCSWISAKNPAVLDYRGAEIILIGANSDLGAHLMWIFPVPSMSRALISEAGKFVLMHLLKGSGLLAAGSRLILLRAETDQAYGFTNSCCLRSIWTWYASDGGAGLCTMYAF